MAFTLHSRSFYEEIVVHANLNLMTKLTDKMPIGLERNLTAREQSEAFRRAWIANTEVKLLERKTKLIPPNTLS